MTSENVLCFREKCHINRYEGEFPVFSNCETFEYFAGVRTFQEWSRYRYGIFPERGFKNDPIYPYFWQVGPQKLPNEGCNTTFSYGDFNVTENVRLMVRKFEPLIFSLLLRSTFKDRIVTHLLVTKLGPFLKSKA